MFYPLKIAAEETRLFFTPDSAEKAYLHTEFASQRLVELQALVIEGRFEEIGATVSDYENHVEGAVQSVLLVSDYDVDQACKLAEMYRAATGVQVNLIFLLSGGAPDVARTQFERLRSASQNGDAELQEMLPSSSG